jgi:hypothetical protein
MFYTFSQNNSGGSFEINDRLNEYVIIEAKSAAIANKIAKQIGIYFDGIKKKLDCECCGNRWHRSSESDATKIPMIYGKEVDSSNSNCVIYTDLKLRKLKINIYDF